MPLNFPRGTIAPADAAVYDQARQGNGARPDEKAPTVQLSPQAKSEWLDLLARNRAMIHEAIRLAAEAGGCVLVQYRSHDKSPMGAMLSREPTGGWRMTRFDADGMSGHCCGKDKYEVALLALRSGYADLDRELLHKLQQERARLFAHVWEH